MGRFPGLSNRCAFGLANLISGRYNIATELDIIRFWPLHLGGLVWHLSTQINDGILAA